MCVFLLKRYMLSRIIHDELWEEPAVETYLNIYFTTFLLMIHPDFHGTLASFFFFERGFQDKDRQHMLRLGSILSPDVCIHVTNAI